MFLHVCVILFTGRGFLPQCLLGYRPPGPGIPLGQAPPPGPGTPLGTSPSPPSRPPPPDQASPGAQHAGRYGQRAGGTHSTGMQSCQQGGSIDFTIVYQQITAFGGFKNDQRFLVGGGECKPVRLTNLLKTFIKMRTISSSMKQSEYV